MIEKIVRRALIVLPAVLTGISIVLFLITTMLYILGIQQVPIKSINLHIDGNLLIALATIILALVGYQQLTKLSSSNSLQFLFHIEEEWTSEAMSKKRKLFAENIQQYLKEKNINNASPDEWRKIQNIIENVIDFFEKIAHITEKGEFSLEDVYQMYSYYIQGYWEVCERSGYIRKVRDRKDGDDFYNRFEWLYKKIMRRYKLSKSSLEDLQEFCEEEKELS